MKPEMEKLAREVFADMNIEITSTGSCHLGAVIGSQEYKEEFIGKKVKELNEELNKLSKIGKTEPHAAYTAFTHGWKHKWIYISRTIPDIGESLMPLENCIRNVFIPAISNGHICTDEEREILALPPRLGGLGIPNPTKVADQEYHNSLKITANLKEKIINQDRIVKNDVYEIKTIRREISKARQLAQEEELRNIIPRISEDMRLRLAMAQEVGASNWLTALPIKAKGFSLNKQEFTDALALRHGWPVGGLPDLCACGSDFDEQHALTCQKGGFVSIRHDEVRNITHAMLKEVCRDVTLEPQLLPLQGEEFFYKTANTEQEARVDVSARNFWIRGQQAFFDIRVFSPFARCYRQLSLGAAHLKNEREKERKYGERIRKVESGSFTPLVFTVGGGMSQQTKLFYRRIAELMAERKDEPKGFFTAWLRCRLSFSLLKSAILCLRGTRSSKMHREDLSTVDYEDTAMKGRIAKTN